MGVRIYSTMGYLSLNVWVLTNIIQLGTQDFCERFLSSKTDPCGRQFDQMTQAARSGVANIAEGYSWHQTSRETEMKLLDVARASLAELMGDYYNYLLHRKMIPWAKESEAAREIYGMAFERAIYKDDWLRESAQHVLSEKSKFDKYFCSGNAETVANTLLFLCLRAINMLEAYIAKLLGEFRDQGGFTENMTAERLEAIKQKSASDPTAPICPKCGAPMIKKMAKKGVRAGTEFWSCSNYLATGCRGTRNIDFHQHKND